ncbi:hypothetical protein [Paenarthrobacter ureafaciens]|uniref:hypothetical protein n=1 Tax=Paenarthrobacter ureafaciens TaxID=37931 RepID=UPI0020C1F16B|nr:hypothetical protein [Paenarthrobacter ureafaciens]
MARQRHSWKALIPLLCTAGAVSSCQPVAAPEPGTSEPAAEIVVDINQSRDQYGKQAILIQLTNTSGSPVTVSGVDLRSGLFQQAITWRPENGQLELPPNQPKSLPASLPEPRCGSHTGEPPATTIHYARAINEQRQLSTGANDSFGVLQRNSDELCLAKEAAAVASIALAPELDVAPDGRTAVVRLVITPYRTATPNQTLVIESIGGTTLLAEQPSDPWPRDVAITAAADARVLSLRVRPARCDPHAVAEDKVGTLLPLNVAIGNRQGALKVPAPADLRGRIRDFVTAACSAG